MNKYGQLKRHAKEYVELEANTRVISVRLERRHRPVLAPSGDTILRVRTTDRKDPDWWVIGGGTPMNLYSVRQFPESDVAYSLHLGLLLRMAERNAGKSEPERKPVRYDAFICHASEDKRQVVKPLARQLSRIGSDVWYDEFEMRVGDSLRRSIDKGLRKSRFGIVILSKHFFAKKWPKYELDGLIAREVRGKKVVLPVWHGVTQKEVLRHSPTLADRVALDTARQKIPDIAGAIGRVIAERRLTGL
jgi:hypothetical protein